MFRDSPCRRVPFAHTYSIIAIDRDAAEMGAAVQSHWFSVGSIVPWARAGAGVVVTQSFAEPSYGPLGLDMLEEGMSPQDAISALTSRDKGRELRQVAIMDVNGEVAAYTGSGCIPEAGDIQGNGFSVQANMMLRPTVPAAMAEAFENEEGRLAERLLAALMAAEKEGGDIRGRQSASLMVVRASSTGMSWKDRLVDLRVDDSVEPLNELSRLLRVHRAYEQMSEGDCALARGDYREAMGAYSIAQELYPENAEMPFWTAVNLANSGRVTDSLPLFSRAFQQHEGWRIMVARLAEKGRITVNDADMGRIVSLGQPPSEQCRSDGPAGSPLSL